MTRPDRSPRRIPASAVPFVTVASALAPVVALVVSAAPAGAQSSPPATTTATTTTSRATSSSAGSASALRGEVTPPDLEDLEHVCALATACVTAGSPGLPGIFGEGGRDFGTCVRTFANAFASAGALQTPPAMRACGLRANTCAELAQCGLRSARADVCSGKGGGKVTVCDGDTRVVTCAKDRIDEVRECARGETCVAQGGTATCSPGKCGGAPTAKGGAEDAPKEGAPAGCSKTGDRIVRCDAGRLVTTDCSALGLVCTKTPLGAVCAPKTTACSDEGVRCEGTTSVVCAAGHEVRIDCAAAGLVCSPTRGALSVGACSLPTTAPATCPGTENRTATCTGTQLTYCFAGVTRKYNCKALGFASCVADASGAHCAK